MIPTHPRLKTALALGAAVAASAEAAARAARHIRTRATRRSRGGTLRPGPETPHWNELVATLRGLKWNYGEKARLARILGVPRQRVDDYLVGKRSLPDAERTLILLHWLHARRRGVNLS